MSEALISFRDCFTRLCRLFRLGSVAASPVGSLMPLVRIGTPDELEATLTLCEDATADG